MGTRGKEVRVTGMKSFWLWNCTQPWGEGAENYAQGEAKFPKFHHILWQANENLKIGAPY